jgi:hypothetical protein
MGLTDLILLLLQATLREINEFKLKLYTTLVLLTLKSISNLASLCVKYNTLLVIELHLKSALEDPQP